MKRRDFLKSALLSSTALASSALLSSSMTAQEDEENAADESDENGDGNGEIVLNLEGAIRNVHDPVLIKQDDSYYLFCTGAGVPVRHSSDMQLWRVARGGSVFQRMPEEAYAYVPGADNIWAPDISFYNDRYHLYYSISTFGSNHSAIGLATNKTLHHGEEGFEWVDHGIVFKSDGPDFYNAIDANLVLDTEGVPWMAFGSHWGGIKLIRLDYETGKQSTEDDTLYSIAARGVHPRAIEAPFIVHRGEHYYLFVSFDRCCNGIHSTYNVRVGRSEAITGPYEDRDGVPMMEDGGTQILFPQGRWVGPGHNAIYREADQDYIVYHAYDTEQGGTPTLRIDPLEWDDEGWPYVPGMETEAEAE